MKENKNTPVSAPPKPEVAPVTSTELAVTSHALTPLANSAPNLFMECYSEKLEIVGFELPNQREIRKIAAELPAEYKKQIELLLSRTMGDDAGGYGGSSGGANYVELRLFHGTGNDANRPEDTIPGQFYLSSMEGVGKTFEGTPLVWWEGCTMWPSKEDTVRVPLCHSMDQRVGSSFGMCNQCPNIQWHNNQPGPCGKDVVMFMLSKNLTDIVMVRFAKTSTKAGEKLIAIAKRNPPAYSKWYNVTSKVTVHKTDPNKRWFLFDAVPQTGEQAIVPEALHPLLKALKLSIEAAIILPQMANIYRQAEQALAPEGESAALPASAEGEQSLGQWGGSENV
jgi:hypothetical protein